MVTRSQIVDYGGQCKGHGGQETTSRALVYDAETGALRYSKSRASTLKAHPKSPNPRFTRSTFKAVNDHVGKNQHHHGRLLHHSEGGSGESSPTCVIRNSALRSNSSSPTMSIISKASSEPGRRSDDREGRHRGTRSRGTSSPDYEEECFPGAYPGSEPRKIGGVRGLKKLGINTPGKPGLRGPPLGRMENDSSGAKENGWSAMAHDITLRGEVKEAETTPFKSIQCAVAEKAMEGTVKRNHGGIPMRPSPHSASVMNGSGPGILSFNATYMPRVGDSDLYDIDQIHGDSARESDFTRRTVMGPLLKPTPSKWDDAEKWLAGSEIPVRAKARSGPLLAHMVASQAGMPMPRKGPLSGLHIDRQHSGPLTGAGVAQRSESAEDSVDSAVVKGVTTHAKPLSTTGAGGVLLDFTADEKEQLNLLLDRYSLESVQSRGGAELVSSGSTSPACDGSFLKLGVRTNQKPLVESSPTSGGYSEALNSGSETGVGARVVSRRDMGTAMTPIASVEPSRTGTPLRATTPERRLDDVQVRTLEHASCDNTTGRTEAAESPRVLTEKELQEKTRQEILALGTQLGKANAAAWATREGKDSEAVRFSNKSALALAERELHGVSRTVLATRAAAWEEAEKAKYTTRFQREEAKIQAWENHEKAKAEAEMRSIEVKVERMRSHAHEKLMNKLAAMRRHAEELRSAAETRRTEAAAKAAKRAETIKTTGKFPNLLFLSYLCT